MSISGGIMNMYIHTSNGICMTAVPEPIIPNRANDSVGGPTGSEDGQTYGMYSVRMKTDPVPGYLTAFLLWPDSENQPQNGEIDFPNTGLDSNDIYAFLHYEGDTNGSQAGFSSPNTPETSWHTYTIEWTPTYVNFLIDGKSIGEYDSQTPGFSQAKIPDTPMHWVLQTESTLGAGTATDLVPPSPSTSGNLQVDWVSVWSYDPS
jgi:beta-glucanase (GH16 family)